MRIKGRTGPIEMDILWGDPSSPLVVFIHGLGMGSDLWTNPLQSSMLGGLVSVGSMLDIAGADAATLYGDLHGLGCSVAAWSQRRPVGPISEASGELLDVLGYLLEAHPAGGIAFVCHSRGGLVLRGAMPGILEIVDEGRIRAVVTICTPHGGSSLARWATLLAPASAALKRILPRDRHGAVSLALRRMQGFIEGRGIRELLPGSEFMKALSDAKVDGTFYISVGGTDPRLMRRLLGLRVSGAMHELIPDGLLPEEMRVGLGDGLVTARSAVHPHCDEHFDLGLNHLETVISPEARARVLELLVPRLDS